LVVADEQNIVHNWTHELTIDGGGAGGIEPLTQISSIFTIKTWSENVVRLRGSESSLRHSVTPKPTKGGSFIEAVSSHGQIDSDRRTDAGKLPISGIGISFPK